jgi:branched-chain amino acid transport system ATP-binding protein
VSTLLELDGVEVRYGRTRALRGISLTVGAGQAVGIIGPNGAGKTTTLKAIAGVVRPSAGRVVLDGRPHAGEGPERLVRRGVALVPEGRQIFTTLTVAENLRLPTYCGRSRDPTADVERELARFPILRTYFDQPAGGLSGGEQQMLAISRALLCRPELLLLDEPSLGLAPRVVDEVFAALAALRAEGVTILLVEQSAARTIDFADRTYVLSGGQIELEGTREQLRGDERIERAYFGLGAATA